MRIKETCAQDKEIKLGTIFEILTGRGYGAMLILLSLPFCIPIPLPGFSTPFGIVLALIGLRVAFAKHLWWPKWILERKFSSERIDHLMDRVMRAVKWLQKFLRPRYSFLVTKPAFHRMHGILVCVLGGLLALPLPIPGSNVVFAFPILCIGLGLLEDDGIAVSLGYFLTLVGFGIFYFLFQAAGSVIGFAIS